MTESYWASEPSIPIPSPAASELEYRVHIAAREYALDPPILIRDPKDIESRKHWSEELEPYAHQVQNLITFCRRAPVALIADDVGLGKTISAGMVISELMTRGKVRRVLVICPSILMQQWKEELLAKFRIQAETGTGALLDQLLRSRASVVITTYDSARSRLETMNGGQFEMLVLDEAHKLRNLHGSASPPLRATVIRKKLQERAFKYVVMLTATPIQNRLWDLYSLIDLLTVAKGHANPLGAPDQFAETYIADSATSARRLRPGVKERFRRVLSQYMVRTRRGDCALDFPTRRVELLRASPTPPELDLIRIVATFVRGLNALQQTSILQAMMSSPEALVQQIQGMDAIGPIDRERVSSCARRIAVTSKLTSLMGLLRELASRNPTGWRVVIFTLRKETQRAIERAVLSEFGEGFSGLIQGGNALGNQRTVNHFRQDPPAIHVIVSTDAGAEGLNLQAANVIVNYDLPWNPMIVEQRIGRVQRLASKHGNVIVLNLVIGGSFEEAIVARLAEKLQLISETLGDIESVLESLGAADDDYGFEARIRRLVVDAMVGRDVERATKLELESIENAKRIYQEEKKTVEENLGRLDEMHRAGARPPELARVKPSMPPNEFVEAAFRALGATVSKIDRGLHVVERGRTGTHVYFRDEDAPPERGLSAFAGPSVNVYAPGRQHFEQLIGRWRNRGDVFVCRARGDDQSGLEDLARTWLAQIEGAELVGYEVLREDDQFSGELRIQADASVDHDRYEAILTAAVNTDAKFGPIPEPNPSTVDPHFELRRALPGAVPYIRGAVNEFRDVKAFCEFYLTRREEELTRAASDPVLRQQAESHYTPRIAAELIGVRGVAFRVATLRVRFRIDGASSDEAEIEGVPSTGHVVRQPDLEACGETGRRVPATSLEACSVSGKRVLRALLQKCPETGNSALPVYFQRCEASGEMVIGTALSVSDVSVKLVRNSLLIKSEASGRRAIAAEMVRCEFTGARVCSNEIATSELSGKQYRIDQQAQSTVSGKTGHLSEFVHCEQTQDWVLPTEIRTSSVSGKHVRSDLLRHSEKNPLRLGLESEFRRCAVTGRLLLKDEVERSSVSDRYGDKDLVLCSASSQAVMLPDEAAKCDETGNVLRPDEVARCAVSGRTVDRRLMTRCEASGDQLLLRESATSSVSGRRVRRDLLLPSEKNPDRVGLTSEFVECSVSHRKLLADEVKPSAVSGRFADESLMLRSERSSECALPDEVVHCEISGKRLLPTECSRSALSGKLVDRTLLVPCQKSGDPVLDDELGVSAVSGLRVRRDLLLRSDKSPERAALEEETVTCAVSGRRLLSTEVQASAVSGAKADSDLMCRSALSGKLALPSEGLACEESGAWFLKSELDRCEFTGKKVDRRLLSRSDLSRRTAIARLLVTCPETGKQTHPDELESCSESGAKVAPSALATCSVTKRRALRRLLVESAVSKDLLLPAAGVRSAKSGVIACDSEMVRCSWDGKPYLPSETVRCALSGAILARDNTNTPGDCFELRRVLDGTAGERDAPPELLRHLRECDPKVLGELRDIRVLRSTSAPVLAFCGEHRTMLGLRSRWIGGLVRLAPRVEILGTLSTGVRRDGRWAPEK
jgi:superfamily II DNA or RNA helicase